MVGFPPHVLAFLVRKGKRKGEVTGGYRFIDESGEETSLVSE